MAIILGMAVPAINSMLNSYNLKLAVQNVGGQLNFARQSALANNQSVEVRFYNITDANNSSRTTYRAMQCFFVDNNTGLASTTVGPVAKPYFFPAGVVISSDSAAASTLFSSSSGISGINPRAPPDANHPLPPPYSNASVYGAPAYLYFHFRPTGQTDLSAGTTPFLTIYSENSKIIANNLPADYVTLQIDSINGSVRSYEP